MKTNSINEEYLQSIKINFEKYKVMGDKTFAQLEEKDFHYMIDEESNSNP